MDTGFNEFHDRRAPQPPQEQGWHVDKKVPLTLIFAMIVQAGMVILAVADIKKDVEVLKADVVTLHQRDARIEITTKETITDLRAHLERIDAKLDRLIERGN